MKAAQIKNKTTGEIILDNAVIADNYFDRLKGLMGKDGIGPGEALIIRPCNSVHSFHMKFLFDVAFFDKGNNAIHIIHSMKPWKTSPVIKNAKYVIETSGGHLLSKLKVGDVIEII